MLKLLYLDFEYYNSAEKYLSVVCVAVRDHSGDFQKRWWLESPDNRKNFIEFMEELRRQDYYLVSYACGAEASSLYSLGIDPRTFKWLDLHQMWRHLQNACNAFQYGRIISTRINGQPKIVYTKPPPLEKGPLQKVTHQYDEDNTGSHAKVETGLAAVVFHQLGIDIESDHNKTYMREMIIKGGPFSNEDIARILEYCASDLKYLPTLFERFLQAFQALSKLSREQIIHNWQWHSRWVVNMALIERRGIPINLEACERVKAHHAEICNGLRDTYAEDHYPLWKKEKKGQVFKADKFKELIEKLGLIDVWPRTDGGTRAPQLAKDEKTLEKYEHLFEIKELSRVIKTVGQLRNFTDEGWPKFRSYIGSDSRLRSYFGPYGTQTSRNAPKASHFVLAMSHWLRALIQPEPGRCVIACDYRSQEFAIAALLSGDRRMLDAYESGDPYLYLMKLAGKVPSHMHRDHHDYGQYEALRDRSKSSVLGIIFGMGIEKLWHKLRSDCRDYSIPRSLAEDLREDFTSNFDVFWDWRREIADQYEMDKHLCTSDGWYMWGDNPIYNSVCNMPVQGNAQVALRRAVDIMMPDLEVIAPLHDATYVECDIRDAEDVLELQHERMIEGFQRSFDYIISAESKILRDPWDWPGKKGQKIFDRFQHLILSENQQAEKNSLCLLF